MLYSLTVLLIGIYLGQELNLPRLKNALNLYKEQKVNTQVNYLERFVHFILNKQKN
jgi:hypothetical protein